MSDRTLLLADADRDSRAIYSLMLEHHGFRVLGARDAGDALRLAAEERPALVVIDLYLFREGRPLASLLRGDPRTAAVPLIGLTAVDPVLGIAPGQLDCDVCLLKPCAPSRLVREVQRVLGGSSAAALP